ncbi:MAG: TIGR01777 family oxidoreductase [Bacteroidota bacterium]|nr:TIGR01777 family oxidoreductase [Bacteroidota bacterium]
MNKKILITGATGLIGRQIVNDLYGKGADIKIISTNKDNAKKLFQEQPDIETFNWSEFNNPEKLSEIIEDVDVIINLSGANVGDKRWTEKFKKEIYDSRVETTTLIVNAVRMCDKKPECLINASAVGIYGFRGDETLSEDSGLGNDFLAKLCIDWEAAALKVNNYGVRVVTMRSGIVLAKDDGALKKMITPFKFFIGGHQGSGRQWFSWIHIDDMVKLYIFALENDNLSGPVNGTSPNPVTNDTLAKSIGKILKRPAVFHVPGFALKIAVGEFAENLLSGQKVYPAKAIEAGFKFKYPEIEEALEMCLGLS